MTTPLDPLEGIVCEHCILHHECKRLCVMSPKFCSVHEARERLKQAKEQLRQAIHNREISREQQKYLEGVLERGDKRCEKAMRIAELKKMQ